MQFITALFGGSENTLLNSAFALGIVLVMIVLGLWVLKFFTSGGANLTRGNNRRLTVIDSAQIDGKRRVMIVRRDNVEHLIMTGGPQDLVIESGIVAAEAPQPKRAAAQPHPRPQPATPPQPANDIETPITPDRPVSREAVDRLGDLARPAPLQPRTPPSLRYTALLRPVSRDEGVIPMSPVFRGDKSGGLPSDSVKTGAEATGGQVRLGGRGRFFRGVVRGDRN